VTAEQAATLSDAASLAGIVVLAVPAFSLNLRKKAFARIARIVEDRRACGDGLALDAIAREVARERETAAGRWRRVDEICLYVGYALVLTGAVWRVLD
jgi:hypothetical protein